MSELQRRLIDITYQERLSHLSPAHLVHYQLLKKYMLPKKTTKCLFLATDTLGLHCMWY
jgi:hypothetical protein